jgi:uncharacterized protein
LKFLLLLAILFAVYWFFKSYKRKRSRGPRPPHAHRGAEDMVRCAQCGVHLPRSEARQAEGQLYCGEEHARLGAGKG